MLEQAGDRTQQHRYVDQHPPSVATEMSPSAPLLDVDRRLDTLVKAVGESVAQQFFWKAETDTIQTYEHRLTYRFVHIDSVTGQFCDQQRQPISAEQALAHALPSVQLAPPVPAARMMLAPIVLEPDLLPFVRAAMAASDPNPAPAALPEKTNPGWLGSVFSRAYGRLRNRFLSVGSTAPRLDLARESGGNLQGNDLSLASFTRRPA